MTFVVGTKPPFLSKLPALFLTLEVECAYLDALGNLEFGAPAGQTVRKRFRWTPS